MADSLFKKGDLVRYSPKFKTGDRVFHPRLWNCLVMQVIWNANVKQFDYLLRSSRFKDAALWSFECHIIELPRHAWDQEVI